MIPKSIMPFLAISMATRTSFSNFKYEANDNIKVSLSRKPGKSKFKPNQFKKRKGRSK